MAITSFKPNAELYNYKEHNPFWISSPTLAHIKHLLFNTAYPRWLMTTMFVADRLDLPVAVRRSTLAAYAIQRLRFRGSPYVGLGIYLAYLVPPSILFIPLATMVVQFGLFDSAAGADPGLPDLPGAVLHLAADRLFQVDPL